MKKAFPEAELTVVHVLFDKVEQRIMGNASAPGFVPAAGFYVDPVQTHPSLKSNNQKFKWSMTPLPPLRVVFRTQKVIR